jgi:gamma-glutamylcyclotransferase (GGCT)/AIG2-like uncharacterized protein YtfP
MADYLFVYGTLRAESAHPMAHRLRVAAKHVGRGSTPGLLYDLGAYPAAIFAADAKYRVIGDAFALGSNPRLLADLDKYEGLTRAEDEAPSPVEGMFRRIALEISLDKGGSVEAWAYGLKEAPRARLIGTGDFVADRRLRKPRALHP